MKIKYSELEKSIEIKDGIRNSYFGMKFLMTIILLNAILSLLYLSKNEIGFQTIIWFVLGLFSLVKMYIFIFKKAVIEKIPVNQIEGLKEKSIFGRSRFSIKLLNGKERDLPELKTQLEFKELKIMFTEIGISF